MKKIFVFSLQKDDLNDFSGKQTADYQSVLMRKEKQIEQLNNRIEQFVKVKLSSTFDGKMFVVFFVLFVETNPLGAALRQSNIEKLQLEKRLLSSNCSLSYSSTSETSSLGVSKKEAGNHLRSTKNNFSASQRKSREKRKPFFRQITHRLSFFLARKS